jgi:hypothetical protein
MKILFLRTIVLLTLVFLQISFFSILFPWFRAPLFLLGVIAATTLARSFPSALFVVVPLTLLYEAVTYGGVTWFSVYAVLFSYVTSFLLRRLLLEHQGIGVVLYALLSYLAALFYQFLYGAFTVQEGVSRAFGLTTPSNESLVFSLLVFLPVFIITAMGITRFEASLKQMSERQFRHIK